MKSLLSGFPKEYKEFNKNVYLIKGYELRRLMTEIQTKDGKCVDWTSC